MVVTQRCGVGERLRGRTFISASPALRELALIAPDPAFGGGGRALTEALWRAAVELAWQPELHYLRAPRLDAGREGGTFLLGRGVSPLVPGLDAANVLSAAARIAPRVRRAGATFVSAAAASYGFAAVLARRPYGCWIATSLAWEWSARRRGLPRSRRVARAVGAPVLQGLERATLRRARVLWAISPASRRALAAVSGVPEARILVVPIPVDLARFAPLPDARWEEGLARPELVFVGRADDPRKNVALLLSAFELLRARVPDVRLTLVGSPPAGPLPDGAEAVGDVPSVADHVRRAALLVLPSLQEGFGLVVAEALASGVPVLVTPCGGPEELVRSSGGGEVLSGFDREELAGRAEALLEDRDTLSAMRRRGREHVVREHDPARLRESLREALEVLGAG